MSQDDRDKVLAFIHQVLRKDCAEVGDYVEFLRDGSVIAELLLRSCSTPLGKKKRPLPPDPTPQDRAEKIVNDMFEFGISVENLFEPDDLLKAKDIPKVRMWTSRTEFFMPRFERVFLALNAEP